MKKNKDLKKKNLKWIGIKKKISYFMVNKISKIKRKIF